MRSVLLPACSHPQPNPKFLPDGDCGYCCLAGIMNSSVNEAYEYVDKIRPTRTDMSKTRDAMSNLTMRAIADVWNTSQTTLKLEGLDARKLCVDIWECKQSWGTPSWEMSNVWANKIYEILKNDYALMASIDFRGRGPRFKDRETDHAVLIIGLKDIKTRINEIAVRIDIIITISCSVRGIWECEVDEFLFKYGGFNAIPFILKRIQYL
jgi:hypothetical protein